MTPFYDANESREQEEIVNLLVRVRRRHWFNRCLKAMAVALGCLLSALGALAIAENGIGWAHSPSLVPWVVAGSLIVLFLLMGRPVSLRRAAALADTRGDLKDELKTALTFMGRDPGPGRSPWIALQARRAALTAERLEPAALVPTVLPRRWFMLDGALLLIVVVVGLRSPLPARSELDPVLSSEDERRVEEIQELLLPTDSPKDTLDRRSTRALTRLEQTLLDLESTELSVTEGLQSLEVTAHALSEANLEAMEREVRLDTLAGRLTSAPATSALGEALTARDLDEAADLLRQLAESRGDDPETLAAALDAAARADPISAAKRSELLESLRDVADALKQQRPKGVERALDRAATELETMSRQRRAQRRRNQARRKLGELRRSLERRAPFGPADRERPDASGLDDASQTVEGGVGGLPGARPEWQLGGTDSVELSQELDTGPGGHASGPSPGREATGEPTRLEVQLQMELLERVGEREAAPPQEIREAQSRHEPAVIEYIDAAEPASYDEEGVSNREPIPWRYRDAVRAYFLSLGKETPPQ